MTAVNDTALTHREENPVLRRDFNVLRRCLALMERISARRFLNAPFSSGDHVCPDWLTDWLTVTGVHPGAWGIGGQELSVYGEKMGKNEWRTRQCNVLSPFSSSTNQMAADLSRWAFVRFIMGCFRYGCYRNVLWWVHEVIVCLRKPLRR